MKYSVDNKAPKDTTIVHQEFFISSGLAGAPALHLHLNLNTANSTFTGSAHITQAINPPPQFTSMVSGKYVTLLEQGAPIEIFMGEGNQLATPLYENLDFSFELGDGNRARFKYRTSLTSEWTVIENAHVEAVNK